MEFYGNSIANIRRKVVEYIYKNGELVEDQREEKTLEVKNLLLHLTGKNRQSAEKGLTEVLDRDFAKGLITEKTAKEKADAFDYSYGWQIREEDALPKVIRLLRQNPNTRRAYLPVFHPKNVGSKKEIPCCTGINILIRDEVLELTTIFRSNEMFIAFMTDCKGFCDFQVWLARTLGYQWGDYHHFVGSAHLRLSDEDGILKLLEM